MKAILKDRLYVPIVAVRERHLSKFTYHLKHQECSKCKEKDFSCDECPLNEPREIRTYKRLKQYYVLCRGNLGKIYRTFNNFEIIDKTCKPKFEYPLEFTSSLWENQEKTVNNWLKHKYGIIESPPRSGKTVMTCSIICTLGVKTLVLAHEASLLDQFLTAFLDHTNLQDLRRKYKSKFIVGITNCREDLDKYDICLSTYQSFITEKGKGYVEEIKDKFGLTVVDEVQLSGADCYRKVVDRIESKYRLGLSATPDRKDKLECVIYDIIGPVTSKGKSDEMNCEVFFHNTGFKVNPFAQWTTYIKRLSENSKRNTIICAAAKRDADKGRSVLIVTERRMHIDILYKQLSDMGLSVAIFDGRVPKTKRQPLLDKARNGEFDVFVAIRKMIRLGIDCPMWDVYFNIMPIAYASNYYQEMSRIRTPYPPSLVKKLGKEKPTPIIRVFCDYGHAAVYACLNVINKVHKEQGFTLVNTMSSAPKVSDSKKKLVW